MKRALVVLAVAALLGGCGEQSVDTTAVCVNKDGDRVADTACEDNGLSGYTWFWLLASMQQPAYYSQVVNNPVYTTGNPYQRTPPPADVKVTRNLPKTGAPAGTYQKPVNQAPKVNSPQDKPNPNIKPNAPANPAPKPPPPPAPKAPPPPPRVK